MTAVLSNVRSNRLVASVDRGRIRYDAGYRDYEAVKGCCFSVQACQLFVSVDNCVNVGKVVVQLPDECGFFVQISIVEI